MSTYVLTINGTVRPFVYDSMVITEAANGRNTMTCDVLDPDTSYRPAEGHVVTVTENATLIYAGLISLPSERGFGGIGWAQIVTRITCADYNSYADWRYIVGVIPAGNTKQALQAILPYLTPYGVALSVSQVNGPNLPELRYDYRKATNVLDEISDLTGGGVWDIDYTKKLSLVLPGGVAAPFNIAAGDGNVIGDVEVEPVLGEYANRIILRFSSGAFPAYAFLEFNANPNNNETVKIGGQTYTFQTALTAGSGHVLISGTREQTAANLAAAVVNGAGSGTVYDAGTPANSSATAYEFGPHVLKAQAINPGASGNNIEATTTSANLVWHGEGNSGLATLALGQDDSLTNQVIAEDIPEQGTGGINLREKVIEAPKVYSFDVANALAASELAKALGRAKQVQYVTYQVGIHPGQTQTITLPLRNLSGSFYITDVTIKNEPGDNMFRRHVTAFSSGILPTRWQDDAKDIISGSSSDRSASITGNVVIGGAPPAVSRPWYTLGANQYEWVSTSVAGTWVSASGIQVYIDTVARGTTSGSVRVRLRAADVGVGVKARLWCVEDSTSVGMGNLVTSTSYVTDIFPVTLVAGAKTYELQLQPSVANADVNGVGSLE